MSSISINLRIRSDIDPDLFNALADLPKGRVRSEYIRRLLSQVKVKHRQKTEIESNQTKLNDSKKTVVAQKMDAGITAKTDNQYRATRETIPKTQFKSSLNDFESSFASALGGVPNR